MANILLMMVGLPRSGKSTWARIQNVPIVNPDSIRLATHGKEYDQKFEGLVWFHARIMAESLFLAGHPTVILDATNATQSRRSQWKDGPWERHYVVNTTPVQTCVERAVAEGRPHMVPVIERMAAEWQDVDVATEGGSIIYL